MAERLPASPTERYFEHYPQGAVFELGSFTLTEPEIVDFARQYDPQAMHVDRALAASGPFGGIIASGWHTISRMMPLFVSSFLPFNGFAAPGIDELRWTRPVYPDDTLHVRATILEARVSRSKPDRGLVTALVEVLNQNGEVVMTMKPMNLIRRRPV